MRLMVLYCLHCLRFPFWEWDDHGIAHYLGYSFVFQIIIHVTLISHQRNLSLTNETLITLKTCPNMQLPGLTRLQMSHVIYNGLLTFLLPVMV